MEKTEQIEFLKDRLQILSGDVERLSMEVSVLSMSLNAAKRYNQFLIDQILRVSKTHVSSMKHIKHHSENPWIDPDELISSNIH